MASQIVKLFYHLKVPNQTPVWNVQHCMIYECVSNIILQVKGDEGDYMLHPEVLKALNLHDSFPIDSELKFQINRSRLLLRPLRLSDYREGMCQLLQTKESL